MTTVGYGDLVPHTQLGKMLTIPLMWIGIAVGFYSIYTIIDYGKSHVENRVEHAIDRVDELRDKNGKDKP